MNKKLNITRVKIAFRFLHPNDKVVAVIGWVPQRVLDRMKLIDLRKYVRLG